MENNLNDILSNAHNQLNYYKEKIDYINELLDPNEPNVESEILYQNLKNQINKFNGELDRKVDDMITNLMTNNQQTIQNIKNDNNQQYKNEKLEDINIQSKLKNDQSIKKKGFSKTQFPRIRQKQLSVHSNPKFQKPLGIQAYSKKKSSPIIKKEFKKVYERQNKKKHPFEDNIIQSSRMQLNIFSDMNKKKNILTQDKDEFMANFQLDARQQKFKNPNHAIFSQKSTQKQIIKSKTFFGEINLDNPKEGTEIKDYNEILDEFSLHRFIIRKGQIMSDTEEFKSYKRTYKKQWTLIQRVLEELEQYAIQKNIRLCHVDGKKILNIMNKTKWTKEELISCLVNFEEVAVQLKLAKIMYKGTNGKQLAAICIQKHIRRKLAIIKFKRIFKLVRCVKIIQNFFRIKIFQMKTRSHIQAESNSIYLNYVKRQQHFQSMWGSLKFTPRIEIHLNPISYPEMQRLSTQKFQQKQNLQITRLFRLSEPSLTVIYVSPYPLSDDLIQYYYKLLSLYNIQNFQERLIFMYPFNYAELPSHYSLINALLYSPKSIKRIKKLIKHKLAYLVLGIPSMEDIKLSDALQIPIWAGEVQKSRGLGLSPFQKLDIPYPLGCHDLYDDQEGIEVFARLILGSLETDRWILKIEQEYNGIYLDYFLNLLGRGIATFRVDTFKKIKELRKNKNINQEEAFQMIHNILKEKLVFKIQLACPFLYPNGNKEYLKIFFKSGGTIQAMPNSKLIKPFSVSFNIEPDGNMKILGTYDKICGKEFLNFGCIHPSTSIKNFNFQNLCNIVSKYLYECSLFGFFTIDLLAFQDPQNVSQNLFWAIGLDCFLNTYTSGIFYYDFIKQKENQEIQMNSIINSEFQSNSFFYTPYLQYDGLTGIHYNTFFHMCRIQHIFFDLDKKSGATFFLSDSLQSGVISLIAIGQEGQEIIEIILKALNFIVQLNQKASCYKQLYDTQDAVCFGDIFSKIKLLSIKDQKQTRSKSVQQDFNQTFR